MNGSIRGSRLVREIEAFFWKRGTPMGKVFVVETVVERTLSEFHGYRDDAVQLHLFTAVDSFNFHWFELRLQGEVIRLEAIRSNPDPDKKYRWEWPESYRLLIDKGKRHTEQIIQRGDRGAGLLSLEVAGMKLLTFNHLRIMQRKRFVSLSYRVGRLTKTLRPQTAE
jgi:hypothetical protein